MNSKIESYKTISDILSNCNIDPVTGCWAWKGAVACSKKSNNGATRRGVVIDGKKPIYVYRFVYEMKTGEKLQRGTVVRHTCDNPICCNPDHLLSGTSRDNSLDAAKRGRLNHVFTDEQVQAVLDAEKRMPGARIVDIMRAVNDPAIKWYTVRDILERGCNVARVEYRKSLREAALSKIVERPSYGVVESRQRVEPGFSPVVQTEVLRSRSRRIVSLPPAGQLLM